MILANLPSGSSVFVDANVLIYHVGGHPHFGLACSTFMQRIENGDLLGYTAVHVFSEVSHKAMLLDASRTFGWPLSGSLKRLQKNPTLISQLSAFRSAVQQIRQTRLRFLTAGPDQVDDAAVVSRQAGLFSNDALIVAVMKAHGLSNLASHDSDFDRVPGIIRFAPV